jgi:hypothetical protein
MQRVGQTAVVQLLAAVSKGKPDAIRLDELDDDRKPPTDSGTRVQVRLNRKGSIKLRR